MLLLENPIQRYAWGRRDGMAELVGTAPSGEPEAELWVGAHPAAPSLVVDDPQGRSLDAVIAADPVRCSTVSHSGPDSRSSTDARTNRSRCDAGRPSKTSAVK